MAEPVEDPPPQDPGLLGSGPVHDSQMPFMEHLRELRDRLRNAIIALIIGFIIAFAFKQELFVLLAKPLIETWTNLAETNPSLGARSLYFSSLIEPFWTYFSIAFWAGVFVASPFIFHQIWKFIAPGLYKRERRYGIGFAIFSAMFFIGGAAFCYVLVLPAVFEFLLNYSTHNLSEMSRGLGIDYSVAEAISLQPLLGMQAYLAFAKKLLIGFGLIFELPLVIFFLSLAGVVTHRSLWKFNRWAVVLAFVVSAILTPPEIFSQIAMAGPIVVLYNLSIVISFFVTRSREKKQAQY
jgi:sec-independent protein translocase protein TatC